MTINLNQVESSLWEVYYFGRLITADTLDACLHLIEQKYHSPFQTIEVKSINVLMPVSHYNLLLLKAKILGKRAVLRRQYQTFDSTKPSTTVRLSLFNESWQYSLDFDGMTSYRLWLKSILKTGSLQLNDIMVIDVVNETSRDPATIRLSNSPFRSNFWNLDYQKSIPNSRYFVARSTSGSLSECLRTIDQLSDQYRDIRIHVLATDEVSFVPFEDLLTIALVL